MVFNRNPYFDYRFAKHTNDYLSTARGQYWAKATLASLIPPLGDYMKLADAQREMDEALNLYGMGYDDIKYATKTLGFRSSGFAGSTLNFVSSNVRRLYK